MVDMCVRLEYSGEHYGSFSSESAYCGAYRCILRGIVVYIAEYYCILLFRGFPFFFSFRDKP